MLYSPLTCHEGARCKARKTDDVGQAGRSRRACVSGSRCSGSGHRQVRQDAGMTRVSRQDKLDLLRALVAGEVDKSLQSMLQDFLVEDRCNLVQLKDILEGVD